MSIFSKFLISASCYFVLGKDANALTLQQSREDVAGTAKRAIAYCVGVKEKMDPGKNKDEIKQLQAIIADIRSYENGMVRSMGPISNPDSEEHALKLHEQSVKEVKFDIAENLVKCTQIAGKVGLK